MQKSDGFLIPFKKVDIKNGIMEYRVVSELVRDLAKSLGGGDYRSRNGLMGGPNSGTRE